MEIKILKKVLAANDQIANQLRRELTQKGIFLINVMGSPGAGKTILIQRAIERLNKKVGVIEGDIETTMDAEKFAKLGIPVAQINTGPFGGACHLEAAWIRDTIGEENFSNVKVLFIENIGNLVCPAEFDTGAHKNVLILSVTEGEDKPLKYPLMFRKSHLLLINKCDLLDKLEFDINLLLENIKKINPHIEILKVSGLKRDGIDDWINWINRNIEA
ncbi:MAG TPA: hydrogenase nickel incorporation protein HypB [bacterium (Candidatus Stahlbacteria)]|nr:hydrogenase nickel incorporation protein HypB [Candidatus Stahlbacteria bacterium]